MGNVREWLFTPTPRFKDFAELNAWLALRCEELAQRKHPEQIGRSIADCFAEEKPLLIPVKAIFDGYVEKTMRVSSTCLIKADHNRYSVPAEWSNHVVSVRITADWLRIVAQDRVVAEHARCYGCGQLICNPWHYLSVLEKAWRTTPWSAIPTVEFAGIHSSSSRPHSEAGQRRPGICRITVKG